MLQLFTTVSLYKYFGLWLVVLEVYDEYMVPFLRDGHRQTHLLPDNLIKCPYEFVYFLHSIISSFYHIISMVFACSDFPGTYRPFKYWTWS